MRRARLARRVTSTAIGFAAALAPVAVLSAAMGCASMPDLALYDPDASATDATLVESGLGDVTQPETSASPDEGTPMDGGSTPDTSSADAMPSDAGELDGSDALACLPANAPPEAGCCYAVLPCVGLGCGHCSDCITQGCHANQYCCAKLNGSGAYQGVQCSGDGKNCP